MTYSKKLFTFFLFLKLVRKDFSTFLLMNSLNFNSLLGKKKKGNIKNGVWCQEIHLQYYFLSYYYLLLFLILYGALNLTFQLCFTESLWTVMFLWRQFYTRSCVEMHLQPWTDVVTINDEEKWDKPLNIIWLKAMFGDYVGSSSVPASGKQVRNHLWTYHHHHNNMPALLSGYEDVMSTHHWCERTFAEVEPAFYRIWKLGQREIRLMNIIMEKL